MSLLYNHHTMGIDYPCGGPLTETHLGFLDNCDERLQMLQQVLQQTALSMTPQSHHMHKTVCLSV